MAKTQAEAMVEETTAHLAGVFWRLAHHYGMTLAEFESLVGLFRLATEDAIRQARVRLLERTNTKGGA